MALRNSVAALVLMGSLAVPAPSLAQTPAAPDPPDRPDEAGWMAGCWAASSGEALMEEVWMAPHGGVMVGMSRETRAGGPARWEHLLLRTGEGRLTYSAFPSGQAPTDFPLVSREEGYLRFENPLHDFPRALEYRLVGDDSLRARVFADLDDAQPAFTVPYARVACPG